MISLPNTNPETGIAYGVTHNIPMWLLEYMLLQSPDCWAEVMDDVAREVITKESATAPEDVLEQIDDAYEEGLSPADVASRFFIWEYEQALAEIDDSEMSRTGEFEGVKMILGSLGGAPLLWVTYSPHIAHARLCSPCIPYAGDLDNLDLRGFDCYGIPPEWYDED